MTRKPYVILFVLLLFPQRLLALDCAPPAMNEFVVTGASLIFEGTAQGKKDGPHGDDIGREVFPFIFTVDKLWKGNIVESEVIILRDTYWGDDFIIGNRYLVVAEDHKGKYVASLCGNTVPLEEANGQLANLERIINGDKEEGNEGADREGMNEDTEFKSEPSKVERTNAGIKWYGR